MEIFVKILELLWQKSDPMLIVCILVIAYLQYRLGKDHEAVKKQLNEHLDPKNEYPHPQCKSEKTSYESMEKQLALIHKENREDHQEIFKLIREKQ